MEITLSVLIFRRVTRGSSVPRIFQNKQKLKFLRFTSRGMTVLRTLY